MCTIHFVIEILLKYPQANFVKWNNISFLIIFKVSKDIPLSDIKNVKCGIIMISYTYHIRKVHCYEFIQNKI